MLAVPTYSDLHHFFYMFAVVSGTEPWLIMGVVAAHALVAFAELQKTTVSFVVSVCLSVRPHGKTLLPLDGFLRNVFFEYFSKICRQNSSYIKSDGNNN